MARILQLPLSLVLFALFSVVMWIPALYALGTQEYDQARAFFYSGLGGVFLVSLILMAAGNRSFEPNAIQQLVSVLFAFLILPFFLAVPVYDIVGTTYFHNVYFDMVSALTTTGFEIFDPDRLARSVHLWRALVAWFGGLIFWILAAAVLAPLNLGGFEVTSADQTGFRGRRDSFGTSRERAKYLERTIVALLPIYIGATFLLWAGLSATGTDPFHAFMRATSILSTSGITAQDWDTPTGSGFVGEVIVFCFLFLAITRILYSPRHVVEFSSSVSQDPEVRLGFSIVFGLSVFLFLRHWIGSFNYEGVVFSVEPFQALWGAIFTVMSFLTTTGEQSMYWITSQSWSGLETPGVVFMGLCLIGGGVATTAGGVKLLRVFALYLNASAEMEKLVHPNTVGMLHKSSRAELRSGSYIAWVFFMLFVLTLFALTAVVAFSGASFEEALVASVAALSTTGPLEHMVEVGATDYLLLPLLAKSALAIGMILGRFEILVVLALFAPRSLRT